jgi:hypothetical protein
VGSADGSLGRPSGCDSPRSERVRRALWIGIAAYVLATIAAIAALAAIVNGRVLSAVGWLSAMGISLALAVAVLLRMLWLIERNYSKGDPQVRLKRLLLIGVLLLIPPPLLLLLLAASFATGLIKLPKRTPGQ